MTESLTVTVVTVTVTVTVTVVTVTDYLNKHTFNHTWYNIVTSIFTITIV